MLALVTVGGTGTAVYWQQKRDQAARLELALREVTLLRGQAESDPEGDPAKWQAAVAAAQRAGDLLGPLIDEPSRREVQALQKQVDEAAQAAGRDANLLRAVVDIRSAEADDPNGSASDAAYAAAFRDAGLDLDTLGPEAAAAKIRARPAGLALALAAALDDWANQRRKARPKDSEGWRRLIAAARAADPDKIRDRLREAWSQPDAKARRGPLLELAKRGRSPDLAAGEPDASGRRLGRGGRARGRRRLAPPRPGALPGRRLAQLRPGTRAGGGPSAADRRGDRLLHGGPRPPPRDRPRAGACARGPRPRRRGDRGVPGPGRASPR